MTKHTPGPWIAYKSTSYLDEAPSWIVPGVAHCGDGELSEANARLIAAAPDMLAALELAERWLCDMSQWPADHEDIRTIRDAIAKAKGE